MTKTNRNLLVIVAVVLVGALCAFGVRQMKLKGQTEADSVAEADSTAETEAPVEADADTPTADRGSLLHEGYTLEQVVIMSRHNIRAPMSGRGTVLESITPHEWFEWSSDPSELSVRGGVTETAMGQFFRKWLEREGLFPKNYQPGEGEVRIYANSKQRTIATAKHFSAGLLPVADVPVEYHVEFDKMDPVYHPQLTFWTEEYAEDARRQVEELFGDQVLAMEDNYALIEEVIDAKESEAYKSGEFTGFSTDDLEIELELNREPKVTGSLRTACTVSDALVLQYYEEADPVKAAFGHELTLDEWRKISEVKDLLVEMSFSTPLLAYNVIHPLLQEIRSELTTEGRKFTFLCGHDSDVGPILTCLKAGECKLDGVIETKTPIGGKIVFGRWRSAQGQEMMSVDLVYGSADQLRGPELLGAENPPYVVPLELEGLERNADGLYEAEAVLGRLDEAIGEYDKLREKYGVEPEEEVEPSEVAEPAEEELDEAA